MKEGSGFKQDDTGEIVVSLKDKTVQWRVNGALQASHHAPEKGTSFVPYVGIGGEGDSVEFLGWREI